MSDLTLDDVNEKKAKRDEQGDLIPEEKTVNWYGEEKDVLVYPTTIGAGNKLAPLERDIQKLEPSAIAKVFRTLYHTPDFSECDEQDIKDMGLDSAKRLLGPTEVYDEGNQ